MSHARIGMYRSHIPEDIDLRIYEDAARCRDEGNSYAIATRRILNCWSPPYEPGEVLGIVREAYDGLRA